MKKLLTLFAATMFIFASCNDEISDEKYSVGDIVLKDGSIIKYNSKTTLTDVEKTNAISVIYYVGKKSDTLGKCVLGVGLKKSETKLFWCTSDANAAKQKVDSIVCNINGDNKTSGQTEYFFDFSGDVDGSNNLEQIGEFLKSKNLTDDTNDESKYPAFYYAKNYKNTETKIKGTIFENDWYLPTIAELYPLSKNTKIVYKSLEKLGVDKLTSQWSDWLTTSSQSSVKSEYFCALRVSDSLCANKGTKYSEDNAVKVCAVRRFE